MAVPGQRYGVNLKDDPEEDSGLLSAVRSKASELISTACRAVLGPRRAGYPLASMTGGEAGASQG